ncbi:MAG: ATP-binding protein [Lachnospiraceae bacterium]|nr:ATP-binding protein [Lachnospiraceae bacterium]
MLIFISGMSCTGKTTLINTLEEMGKQGLLQKILGKPDYPIEVVKELTRTMFYELCPVWMTYKDLIAHPSDYMTFIHRVADRFDSLVRKYSSYDKDRIIIFDRAPIDYRINLLLNYNNDNPTEMNDLASHYLEVDTIFSKVPNGDYLFMTNPNSPMNKMEYDGFRPKDYSHRRIIEYQYFRLVSQLPDTIILPDGVTDRIGFIIRSILKG